jgi:large subunit ribosomal protein L32
MVVRMRHTRAHTANRRSHHALKASNLIACSNCKAFIAPHRVCDACGFYKGKKVVTVKVKAKKA